MAGVVVVRGDLILDQVDVGVDVVFRTVKGLGLDGGVHIALRHGNAGAAHRVHHVQAGIRAHDTDLEALQLFRSGDRAVTGVEVARAERIGAQDDEAVVLGRGIQRLEGVVVGFEDLLLVVVGVIDIGGGDDGKIRAVGLDDGVADEGHVEGADHDHLQRLSLVAERGVGIDLQRVAAFRGIVEIVADFLKNSVLGVGRALVEGDLQDRLADLGVVRKRGRAQSRNHGQNQQQREKFFHDFPP